ncbi:hypothetical protein ACHAXM_009674 [Skeletonema potamos]|jgi:diketogulonate reductase-like aldo/keto reductase
MRSRTNANVYRREGPSSASAYDDNNTVGGNGNVALALPTDDGYKGKDTLRKRKFKLPPPPQMTSLSIPANTSADKKEQTRCRDNIGDADAEALAAAQSAAPTSYSNPYQTNQPNFSQISQPYKPNNWYINTRNLQKKRQRIRFILVAASSALGLMLFYFGFKHIQFHERDRTNHHQRHHHDYHHHIHPMTGAFESPLGFAKERSPQIDHSQPILPKQQQSQPQKQVSPTDISHIYTHEVTYFVPVTTLSNGRLLPLIGFGVASLSVNHKEIPMIVNTLLQYASSESEGGGGIAMIDAVIDEKREVESNGGSFMFSGNIHKNEENEEILENSMAKTAISLVGRSISFFGKENMSLHGDKGLLRNAANKDRSGNEQKYDYENRLEVHLLIGLSDNELGKEKTIATLRDIFSELDELVPPFPNNLDADDTQHETKRSALSQIDRHLDLRIHVLLRSPHCRDESDLIVPCTAYKSAVMDEKISKWTESYNVVEKMYDKNLISGIGFDGVYVEDVREFIEKCRIKPQIYRGDVYQALEGYGRRMGVGNRVSDGKELQQVLKDHNITFLASNVAGHVLENKHLRPNAYGLLQHLGSVLYNAHREYNVQNGVDSIMNTNHKGGEYYTVPRLILAYLVKHKVGVLPHAFKAEHLADDAPESVSSLASFLSERRLAEIGAALKAMVSDRDLPEDHGLGMEGENEAAAVFHNEVGHDVHIFRAGKEAAIIEPSHSAVIISNPGDQFAVYGAEGKKIGDSFTVNTEAGGAEDFILRL